MNDPLFTRDFWLRTLTQAIHASAGAAVGILGSEGVQTLHSLPWQAIATSAVFGALISVLASLSSQAVPGTTTASLVPAKLSAKRTRTRATKPAAAKK